MKPLLRAVHRDGTKILGVTAVASLLSVPVTAAAQPNTPTSSQPPQAAPTGWETRERGDAARHFPAAQQTVAFGGQADIRGSRRRL